MNLDAVNSWCSQPDVCRCCLSCNGSWDLTASYVNEGETEVFSEMLQQCFGISMSHLTEWGPSRLICRLCARQLRDAGAFRRQVAAADERFQVYHMSRKTIQENKVTVKSENEDETDFCNIDTATADNTEYGYQEINIIETSTRCRKRTTKLRKKVKQTNNLERDGEDSDTPIAGLSRRTEKKIENKEIDRERHKEEIEKHKEEIEYNVGKDQNSTETIAKKGAKKIVEKKARKPLSERARLSATCRGVLALTSACPFRHTKSWFQCFYCTQEFMEINLLREHTAASHPDTHHELTRIKRFPRSLQIDISHLQCAQCQIPLADVGSMKTHLQDAHGVEIYNECIADYKVDTSPFVCHLCGKEFHVFRSLTVHLNEHYANCICDVCGKPFLNTKRLKVHKRTHQTGHFPCPECGKVLTTQTSKANHIESAHSKRILKCHICHITMKHYNDRVKHMSTAHDITHRFKCALCPREYTVKHYLASHVRQTHGNKNKKCPSCGMLFVTTHALKKHSTKHSGARAFKCAVCEKAYARRYSLRDHMRTHEAGV